MRLPSSHCRWQGLRPHHLAGLQGPDAGQNSPRLLASATKAAVMHSFQHWCRSPATPRAARNARGAECRGLWHQHPAWAAEARGPPSGSVIAAALAATLGLGSLGRLSLRRLCLGRRSVRSGVCSAAERRGLRLLLLAHGLGLVLLLSARGLLARLLLLTPALNLRTDQRVVVALGAAARQGSRGALHRLQQRLDLGLDLVQGCGCGAEVQALQRALQLPCALQEGVEADFGGYGFQAALQLLLGLADLAGGAAAAGRRRLKGGHDLLRGAHLEGVKLAYELLNRRDDGSRHARDRASDTINGAPSNGHGIRESDLQCNDGRAEALHLLQVAHRILDRAGRLRQKIGHASETLLGSVGGASHTVNLRQSFLGCLRR
mmetsp:Transcript_49400/g.141338  ORF Transcript_49400/g.141338 Transcript_49400/m.141338 type:complete len:376 (+) Transcript_49400:64-1191(+)